MWLVSGSGLDERLSVLKSGFCGICYVRDRTEVETGAGECGNHNTAEDLQRGMSVAIPFELITRCRRR